MPKKLVKESENDSLVIEKSQVTNFNLNAEIVAGSLTSNAKELRAAVENELKNYSVERYSDNLDLAKKDKALLNKIKDSVATKRKEITKQWNKPLDDFLDEMKNLEKSIDAASGTINEVVKAADEKEKSEKRAKIEDYWKTLDFKFVSLDKIFNQKWLNKSVKMESVMIEIEGITEKITTELATIKSMNDEDSEILQSFYLDTLDLNATLAKGNQLKTNRELIKKKNDEWKQEQLEKAVDVLKENKLIPPETKAPQIVEKNKTNIMSFTLKLEGTREQLIELRKFIDVHGIKYTKVEES